MALAKDALQAIQDEVVKTADSLTNLFSGNSYDDYQTIDGQPWNSDAMLTDAQKRFQTKAPNPNYPKVGNLTYTYFSINPDAGKIIQKKRNKIQGWSTLLQNYYEAQGALVNTNSTNTQTSVIDSAKNIVSDAISATFSPIIKTLSTTASSIKNGIYNFLGIENSANNEVLSNESIQQALDYVESFDDITALSNELSKYCKFVTRPKIKFETIKLNQYNRKRIVYKSADYGSIKVSFHDVKNSPIQRFFFTYLKLINDSFLMKSKSSFTKDDLISRQDVIAEDWGFNTDSSFMLIDRITVIEWLGDKMTAYNYNNPKITNIEMSDSTLGDWNPQEVSVTFEYEGLTTDLFDIPELNNIANDKNLKGYQKYFIGKDIVKDCAQLVQMQYKGQYSYYTDLATSFISGVLNRGTSDKKQVIKDQLIDTIRKLGFAEQVNFVENVENDIKNYTSGDSRVIYNTLNSPSSATGLLLNKAINQFGSFPINS